MRGLYPSFQQAGGEVALVTQGTVEELARFRAEFELPFTCLADPKRTAYRAYGLQLGSLWQLAGPSVWATGMKAVWHQGVGKITGDPRQLGGTFIVDRSGHIQYVHYPKDQSDLPRHDELLQIVHRLALSPAE